MRNSMTLVRPHETERPCPAGCVADHSTESAHTVEVATIRTDDGGTVCVDRTQRDGEPPEVVVHDEDGNELRLPEYVAVAVGRAVSAAGTSWAVAS
ncbi:hypothetical protein ABZW11_17365 [Nonomuraea sp. NPDC004580]|uniref:hypothetical protein n=1 Tax=Nonomuraea sp. NPDC004580 TaxID=3154552 RepID=UPI0033A3E46B